MKFIDLTGKKFGCLTITKRYFKVNCKRTYWEYICECGETGNTRSDFLNKDMECFHKEDLSGKYFGRWKVLEETEKQGEHRAWICECQCSNKTVRSVLGINLKSGKTKSCGCLNKEITTTHGKSGDRLYTIYNGMKARCNNKLNRDYHNYGARGIKVYSEWLENFMNFYNWAINNGYQENLTIERIDVNGGYNPDNCTWITIQDQQLNKRKTFEIEYKGVAKTLSDWSRELNLGYKTLEYRYKKGYREEQLFHKVGEKFVIL
ncbi:hypothetical protein [Clostridium estertheticum]|uniref:hypothetical protein n=1 Tax=Clostridium estertheticum TaxID=238834 RepID=UPI001C0DEDE7|nr:hypothetical protein [Clostridium estertheticum]MBU3186544.1 hypothetical protein [Clostridium estertheticum]